MNFVIDFQANYDIIKENVKFLSFTRKRRIIKTEEIK